MKTKEEILEQAYICAKDIKVIIPTLGMNRCLDYIKMLRQEMEEKGYFVPQSMPYLASTSLFRKKFKIWKKRIKKEEHIVKSSSL